jgi:hypothetical protein
MRLIGTLRLSTVRGCKPVTGGRLNTSSALPGLASGKGKGLALGRSIDSAPPSARTSLTDNPSDNANTPIEKLDLMQFHIVVIIDLNGLWTENRTTGLSYAAIGIVACHSAHIRYNPTNL